MTGDRENIGEGGGNRGGRLRVRLSIFQEIMMNLEEEGVVVNVETCGEEKVVTTVAEIGGIRS